MAVKRTSLFVRFVTLLTIVILCFSGIYFFVPDLSEDLFGISWNSANYSLSRSEEEELLTEVIGTIEKSYQSAGATEQEISAVFEQVDRQVLIDAANKAVKSGSNAADAFVQALDEHVDFGSLDTDILKQHLSEALDTIDFADAMSMLSTYLKGGVDGLEVVIKDVLE
jgi:hypothetical protein